MIIIFIFIICTIAIVFGMALSRRKESLFQSEIDEVVPDEIVPIQMGKHTIWLRNCEVDNFKAQPRRMRLHIAKEFERKIKKGLLVPIKENGIIVGFVTNTEFRKKNAGSTEDNIR